MQYIPSKDRYSRPDFYKRCGKSGLALSRLSLGLWHNFGDNVLYENARSLVFRAFDLGITHFDIANNYGPPPGFAETNFGRILRENLAGYRDELVISTKAGYDMWDGPYGNWGSRKYMLASLDQSLKRIGVEYVDIFYSHRPDPKTPMSETMGALDHAVRAGKALYVGISNYSAEQTAEASGILNSLGTPCLIHQPRYNMFDRWIENGLLKVLEANGIGCIPFCPLAQGLLTNRYLDGIPADSRAAGNSRFLKPENITADKLEKLHKLNVIAQSRGQTLAQLALVWVLRHTSVTSALIGASKAGQIEDNVKAMENPVLNQDELESIDTILSM
ncbi:MAG: L-glyceraldehyde 3-phosphate reductase [Sedimentisphaerales bacterium]|nr:L-glyceraldehyde 3-phosphate reductase [Sedimentisphaerales bacterium]